MYTIWSIAAYAAAGLGAGFLTWCLVQAGFDRLRFRRAVTRCLFWALVFLAGWYGHPGLPIKTVPWGMGLVSQISAEIDGCSEFPAGTYSVALASLSQGRAIRLIIACREGRTRERDVRSHPAVRTPVSRRERPLTLDV